MLELAVLGLLKERAMHGYELKRQLGQRLGIFWSVSFGSLYPTLKKLHRRRLVEKILDPEETPRARARSTGSPPRASRSSSSSSPKARTRAWEEDKFPLRMAFFRYLKPEIRIRVLERRRAYLEEKLSEGRAPSSASAARADYYTLSLMRHGVDVRAGRPALDRRAHRGRARRHRARPSPSSEPEPEPEPARARPPHRSTLSQRRPASAAPTKEHP